MKFFRQSAYREQDGFTIIELMIALSIMSVILITSTFVMIQIGALYSKGVNQANLQNDTRSVTQDVSSALQFNDNNIVSGSAVEADGTNVYSYCIGTIRYSYIKTQHELGSDPSITGDTAVNHVLWRDTMKTANTSCSPVDITQAGAPSDPITNGGYEMLGDHMSLQHFDIHADQQTAGSVGTAVVYDISVWTAFGDNDLVSKTNFDTGAYPSCNSGNGSQFCATSEVNSSVTPRLIKVN